MRLPRGQLVRSRVVQAPATALATALDRSLTGYAVLEPQAAMLLDGEPGVVTFEAGVPVVAYHVGTDAGGPAALADLAGPGPFKADLYRVDVGDIARAHEVDALRVPPGMPAERLAGDPELAERTLAAAPDERVDADPAGDPVAAFLDDDEKIAAIQERARREAERRAEEWGLDDELT